MKPTKPMILAASLSGWMALAAVQPAAAQQEAPPPPPAEDQQAPTPPPTPPTPQPAPQETPEIQAPPAEFFQAPPVEGIQPQGQAPQPGGPPAPGQQPPQAQGSRPPGPPPSAQQRTLPFAPPAARKAPLGPNDRELRLNFRGVPLEMVLNYLSDAAGFIIVLETEIRGKIDAWSNTPLTRDEAVDLLNTVLAKNGYTAIRNGRTLKIVSRDEAKMLDIPVRSGSDPDSIVKSDEMVTQIMPVRYANAMALIANLQTLIPTYATLTANESGNALVLTATQTDVRRMAEIVKALDTSISSVSTVRVFPLKFADAKELATAVKELFAQNATSQNNDRRMQFMNRFFGGQGGPGGPGGFGGRGGMPGGGSSGGSGGNPAANRIVAVADERSNSLIVSAPEDLLPTVEQLVKEIDVNIADTTELRVFPLKNADPTELASLLTELFPDESSSNNNNQGMFRFRGPFGGGFGNANQSSSSDRTRQKGRVIAVPDERTASLLVSADSTLMPQIIEMVAQLDSSPAKKQKVFIYSIENADVQQVEQVVRDMFDRSNMSSSRNQQNSQLSNRSQQNSQVTGQGIGQGFGSGNMNGGGGQSFR